MPKRQEIRLVPVGRTRTAIVDPEDYEMVRQYRWSIAPNGHAFTSIDGRPVYMHRLILGVPKGMETDHRNSQPLDNRRSNIRMCTRSQNMAHKRLAKNNKLGYKGVTVVGRKTKKYLASICKDRKIFNLGQFNTPQEAARRYDQAAKQLHGEFAWLNFPDE